MWSIRLQGEKRLLNAGTVLRISLFRASSNFTGRVALQMHSPEWASGIISKLFTLCLSHFRFDKNILRVNWE